MSLFHKVNRRRGSVFITILLSYFAILLIPVVIGSYLYQQIEKIMVSDAHSTNKGLLEQIKLVAESRFKEVDNMTLQIALNPKLQWALSNVDENYARNQFNFVDIMNHMKDVRNISNVIDNCFVYFKNTESVLTTSGKTDAKTYFNDILVYEGKSLDTIIGEMFTGNRFTAYLPVAQIKEGAKISRGITYIQTLPLGERSNIKGYLVTLIKEQELDRLIKQIEKVNHSSSYIVDENLQVMMSTSNDPSLSSDLLNMLENESGNDTFLLNDETMIISYISGQNGWKYVSILPKRMVLEQVHTAKNGALTLLLFCIIVGVIFSCWMALRNYRPIRDVVRTLAKGDVAVREGKENEFDYIKQSIIRTMEEQDQLKTILSRQLPVIQANFLSRLVKGHVEVSAITSDSLAFMDIHFQYDYFSTIIIEIDDCYDFVTGDSEQEWARVRFVLTNLSSNLPWDPGYIIEMDRNRLAMLKNTPEPTREIILARNSFAEELIGIAHRRFKLSVTIAVSGFHKGFAEIDRCYREALGALDYRMIYGSNTIIHYENVVNLEQHYYQYPLETEVQLMNYTRSGDYANVERLLEQIHEMNFKWGRISPEMGQGLYYELMSTVIKVRNGSSAGHNQFTEGLDDPVKYIAGCATADEMLQKTKKLFRGVCSYEMQGKTEHRSRLLAEINQYIANHISDNNLSLRSIADHFNITLQYLSNFYKKQHGQNISDYIAQVRIQEAKRLLKDRTLTMAEIAEKIGYANDVGFIRFFKKYEGVSPGKFRDFISNSTTDS